MCPSNSLCKVSMPVGLFCQPRPSPNSPSTFLADINATIKSV